MIYVDYLRFWDYRYKEFEDIQEALDHINVGKLFGDQLLVIMDDNRVLHNPLMDIEKFDVELYKFRELL